MQLSSIKFALFCTQEWTILVGMVLRWYGRLEQVPKVSISLSLWATGIHEIFLHSRNAGWWWFWCLFLSLLTGQKVTHGSLTTPAFLGVLNQNLLGSITNLYTLHGFCCFNWIFGHKFQMEILLRVLSEFAWSYFVGENWKDSHLHYCSFRISQK